MLRLETANASFADRSYKKRNQSFFWSNDRNKPVVGLSLTFILFLAQGQGYVAWHFRCGSVGDNVCQRTEVRHNVLYVLAQDSCGVCGCEKMKQRHIWHIEIKHDGALAINTKNIFSLTLQQFVTMNRCSKFITDLISKSFHSLCC